MPLILKQPLNPVSFDQGALIILTGRSGYLSFATALNGNNSGNISTDSVNLLTWGTHDAVNDIK